MLCTAPETIVARGNLAFPTLITLPIVVTVDEIACNAFVFEFFDPTAEEEGEGEGVEGEGVEGEGVEGREDGSTQKELKRTYPFLQVLHNAGDVQMAQWSRHSISDK